MSKRTTAGLEFVSTAAAGERTLHTAPDACTVIRELMDAYASAAGDHRKATDYKDEAEAAFAAAYPQRVVWGPEGIVAVLVARVNKEMYVTRFDGLKPKPFDRGESHDHADFYDHATRPGRERESIRSFRVVGSFGRLDGVHEGRGLTLGDVIAWEAQWIHEADDTEPFPPYDITFYSAGVVVAVLRNLGDGKGGYLVIHVGEPVVADPVVSIERGGGA